MVEPANSVLAAVPAPLATALRAKGFTELTAVQHAVVDASARRTNLRISSQTGSGKTVALGLALAPFLIDALAHNPEGKAPTVLVIAPTRELAAQLREELAWLYAELGELRIGVVTGGTDIMRERKALRRGATIVVGTPGRLLDHIRSGALKVDAIEHVVLDEADRLLDMGFKDELEAITETLSETRNTHLISATFPRNLREFADRYQPDALHIEGTRLGQANTDIEHTVYLVPPCDRYAALVNLLLLTEGARCLVFVQRRDDTAQLAERLAADGFSALPFSGDLSQAQRTRTLNAFRNDVVRVVVATDVAARGIDVADIATVVHIDLPFDAETYTHRSGRTGRAGQQGRSILLAPPRAERRLQRVLKQARVEANWSKLPSANKIAKALEKRARKAIHEAVASEADPPEADLAYAQLLLSRHQPEELVARLLELARPALPRAPMPYKGGPVSRGQSGKHPRREDGNFDAFRINYGAQHGATPAHLLAIVCRRGDISGKQIGAIRVGPRGTDFEVASDVAEAFLARVSEPDPKDPEQVIERTQGMPARSETRRRSGGPKRRGTSHHHHKRSRRPKRRRDN